MRGRLFLGVSLGITFRFGEIILLRLRIVAGQRQGVIRKHLLTLQQRGESLHFSGMLRVSGEVVRLLRIALQVEELGLVDFWIDHEFPAIIANGALNVGVGSENRFPMFFGASLQYRSKTEPLAALRFCDVGELAQRGKDVQQVAEGIGLSALRDARSRDDEGSMHGVVVEVLFPEESVAPDGQSVITGKDDEGVVQLAARFKGIEDTGNLRIHELDIGIVVRKVLLHNFRGAGPRGQFFIADDHAAIIKGMLGEKVGGDRRFMTHEPVAIFLRSDPGIMGSVKGDIT